MQPFGTYTRTVNGYAQHGVAKCSFNSLNEDTWAGKCTKKYLKSWNGMFPRSACTIYDYGTHIVTISANENY